MYIDANILVYAATNAEELGERARKHLRAGKGFCISPLVVDEFIWALRKHDQGVLKQFVKDIHKNPEIKIYPVHATAGLEALELMQEFKLKPRDAFHIVVMNENGIKTIISDDADFDRVPTVKRVKL